MAHERQAAGADSARDRGAARRGRCSCSPRRSPSRRGLVFGLAPALSSTRVPVIAALQRQLVTVGRARQLTLRNLLVVTQVALSLLLLVVSGLFVRSLQRPAGIDTGYDTRNVVVANVDASMLVGRDTERGQVLLQSILERLRAIPGVTNASVAQVVPLSMEGGRRSMRPEGYTPREGEDMEVPYNIVSAGLPRYGWHPAHPRARLRGCGSRRRRAGDHRERGLPRQVLARSGPADPARQRQWTRRSVAAGRWCRRRTPSTCRSPMRRARSSSCRSLQHYRADVTLHVKGPLGGDLGSSVRQAIGAAAPGLPVLNLVDARGADQSLAAAPAHRGVTCSGASVRSLWSSRGWDSMACWRSWSCSGRARSASAWRSARHGGRSPG